jgi:hypothetical protein
MDPVNMDIDGKAPQNEMYIRQSQDTSMAIDIYGPPSKIQCELFVTRLNSNENIKNLDIRLLRKRPDESVIVCDHFLSDCNHLKYIRMIDPYKIVERFGDNCFNRCRNLKALSVVGFQSLQSIGQEFLSECTQLETIAFDCREAHKPFSIGIQMGRACQSLEMITGDSYEQLVLFIRNLRIDDQRQQYLILKNGIDSLSKREQMKTREATSGELNYSLSETEANAKKALKDLLKTFQGFRPVSKRLADTALATHDVQKKRSKFDPFETCLGRVVTHRENV